MYAHSLAPLLPLPLSLRGSLQFGAESGWPDFLFSVTENEALFRGGDLIQTSSLIDSSTKVLKVVLAFFTPQYGATTIVEMKADMVMRYDLCFIA